MNYDIFFISYNESNAEINWNRVTQLHPNAQKINGIPSISEAHLHCNTLSRSNRFWTIDGDNWLLESLPSVVNRTEDLVYFNALNPIDKTVSSAGGIKLWRKDSFINNNMSKGDFCRFATTSSYVVQHTLSEHRFNATPYESWRHAFRHMTKCYSGIIPLDKLQFNIEIFEKHQHLDLWSYRGYIDAKEYVADCRGQFDKVNLINNYDWLKAYFLSKHRSDVIATDSNS